MTLQMRVDDAASWAVARPGGHVDIDADRRIVERFQAGDTAAFDVLYRQYYRRLRTFCLRRVGDPHDAEEIAQEAFAKAYAALPTFAGERRFYPWVTVIASRLCVDHHRRSGRTEPTAELADGAVEGGQERVLVELDTALIRRAMGRLPDRHRDILRLREEEGWSYNRIADHYGLSIGAVESLLLRARRRLRQEFVTLSGGEGSLGAVPVLGIVWRRLQSAARRVTGQPLPIELGGAAAQALTAAAVAAGLLLPGAFGGSPGPGTDLRTSSPAALVGEAGSSPSISRSGELPASPITPSGQFATRDHRSGSALGVPDVGPHRSRSPEEAEKHIDQKLVEVPGVGWVGVSQREIEQDLQQSHDEVVRWTTEREVPPCAAC